jgi:hypothetical protein
MRQVRVMVGQPIENFVRGYYVNVGMGVERVAHIFGAPSCLELQQVADSSVWVLDDNVPGWIVSVVGEFGMESRGQVTVVKPTQVLVLE